MTFAAGVRRRLQQLGPYKSLGILLIPLILVEPAKMAGVAFMGLGHWVGGACLIVGAYAAGLLVVDRLFRVVKTKAVHDQMVCDVGRQISVAARLVAQAAPRDGACGRPRRHTPD